MKSLLVFGVFLTATVPLFAQDEDAEAFPQYRNRGITDIYIGSGGGFFGLIQADFNDFQKLTGATIFPDSLGNFFNTSTYPSPTTAFSVMGAWQLGNRESSERRLSLSMRAGLLFNGGTTMNGRYFESRRSRIDTLYNTSGTQMILVDSIRFFDKNISHESNRMMLDVGLYFRLFPENRWSLFGGVGIAPGFNFNSVTVLSEREYIELEYNHVFTGERMTNRFYESFLNRDVIIRNKSSWCMLMHLSLGFDFRISNRSEFWRHIHFYMESRPSMFVSHFPEINRSFTRTGGQFISGVRIRV